MVRTRRSGSSCATPFRALLTAATLVVSHLVAGASPVVSEDVPVAGGTAALAAAVGIDPVPDQARFVAEVVRLVYSDTKGRRKSGDSAFKRLIAYLEKAEQLDADRAAALGRGERVRVEIQTDLVPVPLPAVVWSQSVLRRTVEPARLFTAVMSDADAAMLAHGLAALDDETLQFFVDHPEAVRQLYQDSAPAFAAFAARLRIRNGRIAPPGGDQAVPLWEALLGETTTHPERFVRQLFAKDGGRIAYLYDTIGALDSSRASFALGAWIPDATVRLDRFKALASAVASAFDEWSVRQSPFKRPQHDLVSMLLRVRVDATGVPGFPASRTLWGRALGRADGEGEQTRALESLAKGEFTDAAWLVGALLQGDWRSRSGRLDQFAFGQRAFTAADPAALSDVVAVLQAFPRFPMLMLTLERIGVSRPALYAALVRQAERVTALDEVRRRAALAGFQGAIALVARLTRVRTIDRASAEALLETLGTVPFNREHGYMGGLTLWLQSQLFSALGAATDGEDHLWQALAGAPGAIPESLISWEGQQYRFDLVTPEVQRLRRARAGQRGYSIDVAMDLHAIAQRLAAKTFAPNDVQFAIDSLKELPTLPEDARETVDRAIEDLTKARNPQSVSRVAPVTRLLFELVDDTLGEALLSLAYAADSGDPRGTPWTTSNVARRHDFGLASQTQEARVRTAWALPRQVFQAGTAWHVEGAALGLDIALASLALRRTDTAPPAKRPAIDLIERDAFATSLALLNPRALRDEDRDAIAAAVARGRGRVDALAAGDRDVDALVQEIAMDGWRVRALRWTIRHAPERTGSFFSMTDLLYLGGARGMDLNPWGMSGLTVLGCICTHLAPPGLSTALVGRLPAGLLTTTVADLNLRVAVALAELQLPAALAKSVLAVAVQDFVDRVQPSDLSDWLTRVRSAQDLSRERIEDFVATATVGGPLVPDTNTGSGWVSR